VVVDAAVVGIELVPVHPAQPQRTTVDQPSVAGDLDPAEAHVQRHGFGGVDHLELVPPRLVTTPRVHRPDVDHSDLRRRVESQFHPQVRAADPHRVGGRLHPKLRVEAAASGLRVEVRPQPHVVQAARRTPFQAHLAEDAGEPPLVLVLDVAPGRPLVDAQVQQVASRTQAGGDVQLLAEPAAADHADLGPVEGRDRERLDPVGAQQQPGAVEPAFGDLEPDPMVAGGVGVRHERWLHRERVHHVGVDRRSPLRASLEHPVGRDGDAVPAGVVELW